MNKLVVIAGLLIQSALSYSQNYFDYFKQVRKAEHAILDSNYHKAVLIFDSLVKRYSYIYLENYYTAAQTAVVANENAKAIKFIQLGVKEGLDIKWLYRDSILIQLTHQPEWEQIKNKYDSLHSIYTKSLNYQIRRKVGRLSSLDKKWRNKYETHPWNFLWRPFIGLRWKKISQKIVEDSLIPIIRKVGYPGKRLLGPDTLCTINNLKYLDLGNSSIYTVLRHYYSWRNRKSYKKLLLQQVKKGFLQPKNFASIIDYWHKWGKEKVYTGLPYCQYFDFNTIKNDNLDKINRRRKKIGLGTIQFLNQKWQYCKKINKKIKKGNHKHIYLFTGYWDSLHP